MRHDLCNVRAGGLRERGEPDGRAGRAGDGRDDAGDGVFCDHGMAVEADDAGDLSGGAVRRARRLPYL